MIGDKISPSIAPQHRGMVIKSQANNSTLFISLNSGFYAPQHHDASASSSHPISLPRSVLAKTLVTRNPILLLRLMPPSSFTMNGPKRSVCVPKATQFLVTERIEQLCRTAEANLGQLGISLTLPIQKGKFLRPVFEFQRELNLPGFSNGFLMGMGPFEESS